jgi:hypothetical protein
MKPDLPTALHALGERIRADAVPAMAQNHYGSAQMLRGLELLKTVADEMDRAAAWRIEEEAAVRALFKGAAPQVDDAALAADLHALLEVPTGDLRLSALDQRLAALRQQLIALHAWAETRGGAQAAAIAAVVWDELRCSTERRRHGMDRF